MDLHALPPASFPALAMHSLALLACFGCLLALGWILVPAKSLRTTKLLLLSLRLASGMVFATGLSAFYCLQHLNYMTGLAIGQAALAIWLWRMPAIQAISPDADATEKGWTWRQVAGLGALFAILLPLFQIPYQFADADGRVLQVHADLGYFVDNVVALPEAQAANGWAIFLGRDSTAAAGVKDAWYHWGSMMLAVGIRAMTGLPAAAVLLVVVNMLMNVLLVLTAGALAGSLTRLNVLQAAVSGAAAITCINFLRLPQIIEMLGLWLPYDIFHHARVPLALIFPYKFEGILIICALALWQNGKGRAALGMIYLAAVSAPHTVAACGAAMGTLACIGVVRRDHRMLSTGVWATLVLLAGWASVRFLFGSSMPGSRSESIVGFIGFSQLWTSLQHGLLDAIVTMLLSSLLLAGAVHLAVRGRQEGRHEKSMLGWLCFAALAGSSVALQGLRSADRFHVVVMSHAVLIMPVCGCALVTMLRDWESTQRRVGLGLLVAVSAMGIHTLVIPAATRQRETWDLESLAEVREITKGRPVGYFARTDRNWWISKHGLLGGLLESRIIRLNPLDERKTSHFSEISYKIPFEWLPPEKDEPSSTWSLRLAKKLGVRHVLETWEDKLPRRLREQCKPVWAGPGLIVFELPVQGGEEDSKGVVIR